MLARLQLGLLFVALSALGEVPGQTYSNLSPNDVDPQLRQTLIAAIEESDSFDDRFHAEV